MKTSITVLITLLISISSFAQQGINYKAIVKDDNGNVLATTFMNVQFTIHQNTATGSIVYQEDYNYTTDNNGMLILNIGSDPTPSMGVFETIDWSANPHFLQMTITYSGGTVNFNATEFMAVPYAKHAKTATTAANVFSGDYNDLINQPTTLPSGLEQITENDGTQDNTGWRLINRDPDLYGSIGENAIDLSFVPEGGNNNVRGATGENAMALGFATIASGTNSIASGNLSIASGVNSVATGIATEASGSSSFAIGNTTTASGNKSFASGSLSIASADSSTAMGNSTTASGIGSTAIGIDSEATGRFSTAMGFSTVAPSYVETTIGAFNTDYTLNSTSTWEAEDRLFVIGNGTSPSNKSDALIIYKNGAINAPTLTNSNIDNANVRSLITKQYVQGNYLSNSSNLIPIAYGVIDSNGDILSGAGNFMVTTPQSPTFQIEITGETLTPFNSSVLVTPLAGVFRTASTTYNSGEIRVYIFNSNGSQVTNTFQFVVYKL